MRAAVMLLIATAALSAGCAGAPGAPGASAPPSGEHVAPSASPQSFAELAMRFTDRALEQERAGNLRRAIESWRAVAALRPDAKEPKRRIEELTARLAAGRRPDDAGKRGAQAPPAAEPGPAAPPAEPPLPPDEAEEQLAEAGELFAAGAFEAAADTAERLAGNPAVGNRAKELAGNAWFAAGEAALKEDRLADALAAFRKAEPVRRDAAARVVNAERLARERAEEYYNAGVRHFVDQDLTAAIRSWERALALNPAHPNAAKDIEKARELQQKLQEIK